MNAVNDESDVREYLRGNLTIRLSAETTEAEKLRLRVELVLEGGVIDHDWIDIEPSDTPEK